MRPLTRIAEICVSTTRHLATYWSSQSASYTVLLLASYSDGLLFHAVAAAAAVEQSILSWRQSSPSSAVERRLSSRAAWKRRVGLSVHWYVGRSFGPSVFRYFRLFDSWYRTSTFRRCRRLIASRRKVVDLRTATVLNVWTPVRTHIVCFHRSAADANIEPGLWYTPAMRRHKLRLQNGVDCYVYKCIILLHEK